MCIFVELLIIYEHMEGTSHWARAINIYMLIKVDNSNIVFGKSISPASIPIVAT